ncbi:MAG TPA: Ada metal-binding domain-containing protein [Sedimentisphaerales bacterium]|nr:Ada metal-binding domain-containing protein [Sedimentisphaerales bacterium]
MKVEKCFLILAVAAGLLCLGAPAGAELPEADESVLLGHAYPMLAGIERLQVVIRQSGPKPDVWKELETKIGHRLKEAGIRTVAGPHGWKSDSLEVPELRVYIDAMELKDSQQSVFHIQTLLASKVSLESSPSWFCKAEVWKVPAVMQAVSAVSMTDEATNVVLEQLETFISACAVANAQNVRTRDANNIGTMPGERGSGAFRAARAEYRYVASKKSKVFHKSGCRSAERISPENLVGYNSTDEAIAAGKRPCKRCGP